MPQGSGWRCFAVVPLALMAHEARAAEVALDNSYVRVTKDGAPCAIATTPGCGDRVVVAMGDLEIKSGNAIRMLARGEVAVFLAGQSYEAPASGSYFEVAIKPGHPPVKSPPEIIPPEGNAMVYDGDRFIVYQEQLAVGATRPRHSHSQRVEIRINQGPLLEQHVDGNPKPIEPQIVNFREATIHTTHNVGDMDLRNVIVEFRPEKAK
ncbi:MAG TPA: hypothetical protein VN802_22755 [Stellaceae bacterium]|nr:hypothetical protein [Stellaceae bacterium]